MMLRTIVKKKIGDDLIIWVNPAHIDYYVGKNIPLISDINKKLKKYNSVRLKIQPLVTGFTSFAIPDRYYRIPKPINKHEKFQKIDDLIKNRKNYWQSEWYKTFHEQIKTVGMVKHKNIVICSKEELNIFFQSYVLDLVESMERD